MAEPVENILKSGYALWKKNLHLAFPFLLDLFAKMLLYAVALVAFIAAMMVFFSVNVIGSIGEIQKQAPAIAGGLGGVGLGLIAVMVLMLAVFILLHVIISSFFTAGAIGMSRELLRKGRTDLSDMVYYGKKKIVHLSLFNILMVLLYSAAIVLLLLRTYVGMDFLSIYVLILGLLSAPRPYVIVAGNSGFVEGIEKGIRFIRKNPLSVVLLHFVAGYFAKGLSAVLAIIAAIVMLLFMLFTFPSISLTNLVSAAASLTSAALSMMLAAGIALLVFTILVFLVSATIVAPLTTLWWTRLYLGDKEDFQ